ncbi:MAG: multidrug efflux RND transporter permease subunit [marine benthic group bacterium]|nr:multidrug efflux RND transporter permease subunit [Candidatus Carthagonibacter metallireducens]MCL7978622.1 multidrug efflux RND transporter permease subunit [Gemmatimonadota bacterium]
MFSRFFIYRPVFALVISIVVVILGTISIPTLPVESMPDITPPTVEVSTNFPGANAQVVEQTVTTPIEKEVNGVEDMIYMQSKSTSVGSMELTVSFDIGTDPDMAAVLTQNRVSIAEPLLPEEVKRQGVKTEKKSTQITLMVNLISPDGRYDDIFISNYATTQINDVLARVPGVGKVVGMGAKDFGMRIWIDPQRLRARDLTTDEVVGALREQNVQVAAGAIGQPPNPEGLNFQYTITTQGRLETVEQFENIIVKAGQAGELVRVRDVARVELGAQNYSWYVQLDGRPSVGIAVYQLPGSNALAVKRGVADALAELEQGFPEGLEAVIAYDSTEYIEASISEVIETLIIAILLVIFSVFIFLQDWRTTVIPSVTIPVSLIGTFFAMKLFGMSINNLTLFGLVLAIGIVVDDAIVVVENTMRLIDEEGMETKAATAKAMEEVGGAIVATTLVLLAVFVPTALMPGLTGRLYQQFAITISIATVFSSINALTLSPALAGMLLRPSPEKRGRFFTRFNDLFEVTTDKYMGAVRGLVRRKGAVLLGFAGLMVAMFLSFRLVPGGFIPDEDQGYFFVNVELPDGASMQRTEEVLDRVNLALANTPGVANYITIGGFSMLNAVQGSNFGAAIATLDNWSDRSRDEHVETLMANLQRFLFTIQEGTAFAFGPPPITGLGNATGFSMELQDRGGLGLQQLQTFAEDMVAAGTASPVVERLNQNFTANVPQLFVDVDRNRVKTYGVPLQSVFNTLQANLGSAYVNDFNIFGRTWKVQVQADEQFRSKVSDIDRLEVRNANGDMIPMGTLAQVRDTVGPNVITRFNMFPASSISGVPAPGKSSGEAVAEMERLAAEYLPPQMGYQWSGVTFQQIAAGNLAPIIFSLAIIFVFLFMAAQYESWLIPLAVLMGVPMAIFGAMLGTGLRQLDNNIYTQIGLVLLIGLAAKTAILIVEFAKQQREEGKPVIEAAETAALLRFRPILMTAFSFILGVIPLAIASGAGAASRISLGTAVLFGMLIATASGVFLIPAFYVIIQGMRERKSEGGSDTAIGSSPAEA